VHFHVPVFIEDLGTFSSTRFFIQEVLAGHRRAPVSPHLEVETYTWNVLPAQLRTSAVEQAVARELGWVLEQLQGPEASAASSAGVAAGRAGAMR
jgi:hypothetical protein